MENVVGHRGSAEGQLCYELYVQTCAILAEHFHPNKTEKPNTVHIFIRIKPNINPLISARGDAYLWRRVEQTHESGPLLYRTSDITCGVQVFDMFFAIPEIVFFGMHFISAKV